MKNDSNVEEIIVLQSTHILVKIVTINTVKKLKEETYNRSLTKTIKVKAISNYLLILISSRAQLKKKLTRSSWLMFKKLR